MEVILLEKVHNLGGLGDKVRVKSGYGRNFLLPKGMAVPATPDNVAKFEARRAELEAAAAAKLAEAQQRSEQFEGKVLTIAQKAGDEGRLFGSVGTSDIAEAAEAAGIQIEKREVRLPDGPIRNLGEYDIELDLHSDLVATIKVIIVAE